MDIRSTKMKNQRFTGIIRLLFALNTIFLVWAVLWKCGIPFVGDSTQRVVNIVPFNGNTAWEMQFNVLLFFPYGFLLCPSVAKRFPCQVLIVAATSVFMEILQYALAVGRSDITDVLLNTAGGIIGIAVCFLFVKLLGRHSHIAVLIIAVLIVLFEIYVSVSLLLFGMVRLGFVMLRL